MDVLFLALQVGGVVRYYAINKKNYKSEDL